MGGQEGLNVTLYSEDTSAVDKDLGEDVEDGVVYFARRRYQKGHEGEDDTEGKEHDGGPFLYAHSTHAMGGERILSVMIHRPMEFETGSPE